LAIVTAIPAEILVHHCLNGDHAAYRELYNRYCKAMFNTALRLVNRTADAEDILQEAFIDAFAQLSHFENKSSFGAWLKQIVVYKSIGFLKKKHMSFVDMEIAGDVVEENEVSEEDQNYTVNSIRQTMKELPDGYRTVLSLYLLEGYDHEEIAEILGVAPSTVRTQYIRAKQKLLQLLKKEKVYERS
jgi:RNA polymerase sigma factor (sigma-70 family)